ncbi:cation:proton antiporter [Thiosocius teredinicola]|uniref:cation:proton antiporter n=1 Tax=Thiosocius teredinicola TaxID=1973002 RepID=UPI000990BF77
MGISHTIMMLAGLLLVALMLRPFAERRNLPFAALLVATGFVGSELLLWFDIDTGVRHQSFHDLIFYVFLPLLVFEAAFKIDALMLRKNLFVILLLSIPILLLSILVTASLVYIGIGHPEGFPWIAAMLTGAVLAATDASPITARFAKLGVPKRLRILMEGEDLFNDATAIVMFNIVLYIAMYPQEHITVADAVASFAVVFFGGIFIGLLVGLAFLLVSRLFEDSIQQALVSLISAYAAFLVANEILQVSGVMAVLITGLIMGRVIHNDFQDERGSFVDNFWAFNVYVAEALVFLLMGVTVTFAMFEQRWLAMLIGIVAVLISRATGVFGTAPLINRLPWIDDVPRGYQQVLVVGSLRGAVVLALCLSLPVSLPYWWTVQSIAFGVVIFSLFVQAPLVPPLLKRSELLHNDPG